MMQLPDNDESPLDLEGYEPVRVKAGRRQRDVFSLRIGAEELDRLVEAAEKRKMSVGEFIRQAALKEAASDETFDLTQTLQDHTQRLQEITEMLRQRAS